MKIVYMQNFLSFNKVTEIATFIAKAYYAAGAHVVETLCDILQEPEKRYTMQLS